VWFKKVTKSNIGGDSMKVKVEVEFFLPEEIRDFDAYRLAPENAGILEDIRDYCNDKKKYADLPDDTFQVLDEIQKMLDARIV
jgi:hypothetical protein